MTKRRAANPDLQLRDLVEWNDEQMDAAFRAADTLPLDGLENTGQHSLDVAQHEIWNDASWKGFLPKGLPVRSVLERLSTGYAKRFWKKGGKVLGETIYVNGRILVNHQLEEVTLTRRTNDLDPGRYIVLYYTDPVFEHVFYDVMRAVSPTLILYRGYTGRFPDGRRGFTAPLARRYTFQQMGPDDHARLFEIGRSPSEDDVAGRWLIDAVATSNQPTNIGTLTFARKSGRLQSTFVPVSSHEHVLPPLVGDHFNGDRFASLKKEMRALDDSYVVGRWPLDLRGPFAALLLAGAAGIFQSDAAKRTRRFRLDYILRRE